jgi:hypothetical protein
VGPILKTFARDIGIIFLLTFIGGFLIPFAPVVISQNEYIKGAIIASLGIVGFCIAGCLATVERAKHLGKLFFWVWFISVINVFVLGQAVSMWIASSVLIAYMAILGGGLSCLLTRTTSRALSVNQTIQENQS